jgi:AraC-like DNA-binding protein
MRLVRPCLDVIKAKGHPEQMLRFLDRSDVDSRISVRSAVKLLDHAVRLTRDPDLGLRAVLHTSLGDYDALEYAAASCSDVAQALDLLKRYFPLLNEASEVSVQRVDGQVHLQLYQPCSAASRPAIDYALGVSYRGHMRWVGSDPAEWEVWFPYPEPASLEVYGLVFHSSTRLRFDAPANAFVFRDTDLTRPLLRSDPKLHQVLLRCVEDQFTERPRTPSLTHQVRSRVLRELVDGNPTADHVARALGVSRRTLTRRLEEEGTSFKALLSDVRCTLAVRYLLTENLGIAEIVKRLGYSEPAAFHKASKRWFGKTPIEYLRQHRPGHLRSEPVSVRRPA